MTTTSEAREESHVTIVGGGIAGLYAAYLLALNDFTVDPYELHRENVGGKIATRSYPTIENPLFKAEFGPMRFELDLQIRLRRLCQHLNLVTDSFPGTVAPVTPNEFEMTEVEAAFELTTDLHLWAVLRMFFGRIKRVRMDLDTIHRKINEMMPPPKDVPKTIGALQLAYLQCYVDRTVFCTADRGGAVRARPDDERDSALNELRRGQRLWGDNDNKELPYLRDIGLWLGLSEVISPGAIARIRENGTFYHFVAYNPSAVEWGIFWLRQASVLGTLSTIDSPKGKLSTGVFALVNELVEKIEKLTDDTGRKRVAIQKGFEVLQVEPAKRPNEVVLRIQQIGEDGRPIHSFNVRTDHVVLALPQLPLRRLWEHFPEPIRSRIDAVEPIPLLKAFIVTKKPWWPSELEAQSYAWLVPTRELHFSRNGDLGMIMLYTDEPAIQYWDILIPAESRNTVLWTVFDKKNTALAELKANPFGLLEILIRRLLAVPNPGLPELLEKNKARFRSSLNKRIPGARQMLEAGIEGVPESERVLSMLEGNESFF